MLAKLERSLPLAGYVYEPKWDGFRQPRRGDARVTTDGRELVLTSLDRSLYPDACDTRDASLLVFTAQDIVRRIRAE